MGKFFEALTDKHIDFIEQQKIYFVGTAAETGSVNISPKGCDSLRVLGPNQIAWLNLTGSGNESAAHILKIRRMTIMFCAFEGAPLILRTYGEARMLHPGDAEWPEYIALFPEYVGARQIFIQDIERVQTSCGMSVPYYDFVSDRHQLDDWADKHGQDGIKRYWRKKNQSSIDGFPTEIVQRAALVEDED